MYGNYVFAYKNIFFFACKLCINLHIFAGETKRETVAKNTRKMGETLKTITCETWCEQNGVKPDALRMAFPKIGLSDFAKNRPLSVADIAKIEAYPFRSREEKTGSELIVVTPAPKPEREKQAKEKPAEKRKFKWPSGSDIRRAAWNVLLIAVVVGHTALIWYDCAEMWHTPGLIGGGIVFAIVCAALLLASDPTRTRSSASALWFVFFVDAAAGVVHFLTFRTPEVDDVITGVLCAFLCASSFWALYLYRDVKID